MLRVPSGEEVNGHAEFAKTARQLADVDVHAADLARAGGHDGAAVKADEGYPGLIQRRVTTML